ncbi:hypothetical protein AAVH_25238 [Aphelenchoides avenae]|nr:hypothetical protein AAVH_25238 [Aphelenchus avenae]
MGNWATPEPNPAVQRAELKAKAATDATDERPRRHPRMSLLPGDKPAMIAVNTKKKKASYIPPLVLETRAMTRAEITVMMRKKGLNRDPCPYLELVVTPDKGIGVRAANAIPIHAYVMEYLGEVIPYSKTRRTADYVFGLTGLWGEEEFFIDAEAHFNKSRLINHSCDPNLVARYAYTADNDRRIPRIVFFAKRYIVDGEELSFDYHEGMSAEQVENEFRGHLQDCR